MSTVRKATPSDLQRIMQLVEMARGIMRSDGNMTQWDNGYPDEKAILEDIEAGNGYMVSDQGYFALIEGPDPCYGIIQGEWLYDNPYYVIHRIASTPDSHGIMSSILEYAFRTSSDIRIDTHEDNHIMQHILTKAGFSCCGVIHLKDGAPRLAFEKRILQPLPDCIHLDPVDP